MLIHVDSDFAGCQVTRKSTSGGTVQWGRSTLNFNVLPPPLQSLIVLSSGEAELAAIVTGSTELLDFGIWIGLRIYSDASAAIGRVKREGLGKVRHCSIADLRLPDKRARGEIAYEKVNGLSHPADMLTKGVNGEKTQMYLQWLGFGIRSGRNEHTPEFKG